jgi:hypothetical protein
MARGHSLMPMSCAPASYSACAAIFDVPRTAEMRRKSSTEPCGVAGLLLGFTLSIDSRREALGEIGAHLVVRWQQVARGDVTLLGLGELHEVEVGLAR